MKKPARFREVGNEICLSAGEISEGGISQAGRVASNQHLSQYCFNMS
ncbi:MAG: hypothetical protein AB1546_04630 [bacterium]